MEWKFTKKNVKNDINTHKPCSVYLDVFLVKTRICPFFAFTVADRTCL